MNREPRRCDPWQAVGAGIQRGGVAVGNAELVARAAGADLGVRAGLDVRIDPQCDPRRAAHRNGNAGEHVELLRALDIDLADPPLQREAQLGRALADAREHDALRRDASRECAQQFAAAHHVGAGALGREYAQHREMVVRLHRVVDARPESIQRAGQRAGQRAIARPHDARRVDPDGRAQRIGHARERHAVHHQPVHHVHGEMRPRGDQLGDRGFRGAGRVIGCGGVHRVRIERLTKRGHREPRGPFPRPARGGTGRAEVDARQTDLAQATAGRFCRPAFASGQPGTFCRANAAETAVGAGPSLAATVKGAATRRGSRERRTIPCRSRA